MERIENPLAAVTEERAAYLQQEKEFYKMCIRDRYFVGVSGYWAIHSKATDAQKAAAKDFIVGQSECSTENATTFELVRRCDGEALRRIKKAHRK